MNEFYDMGVAAFKKGKIRAPSQDSNFMSIELWGASNEGFVEACSEWLKGYDMGFFIRLNKDLK